MFDLGFGIGEIILLALVALIVVGPQDLPNLLYKAGKMIGNLRNMASEFKYAMDDIVHEQEIEKTKKMLEAETAQIDTTIKRDLKK
ncbi:MAG: sec-independent protein translocase protein TatB [Alphaproteobacteria bacterium]|jgi:sec-independent protein translocase protein TatB